MSGDAKSCFHCSEPLGGSQFLARLADGDKPVCCAGCQAVAEMIASTGLDDFYARRTRPSPKPTEAAARTARDYAHPEVADHYVQRGPTTDTIDLLIENLRCSACGWLIERTVGSLDGITAVEVNPVLGRARIEWRNDRARLAEIVAAIERLGYIPHPLTADTASVVQRRERHTMLKRFIVATFGMMQVMMFAVAEYSAELNSETIEVGLAHYFRLISLLVSVPVLFYAARPMLENAWNNIRTRTIGMDLPVSAALVLAFVASTWNTFTRHGEVYFDSITMFVFFLTLSRLIELSVRHRTHSVSDALASHLPATAQRVANGKLETVATSQLRHGDIVLVPSGAIVPADGRVLDGQANVNEALLSGESLPVARREGDEIACGSINVGSPVRITVTKTGSGTMLASIAALIRRAQTYKPHSVQTADRAAALFLRIVLIASVCVCAAWLVVDPSRAFSATLAVLVVACPCAFSIAMPAALAATTARLAREGVLITRIDALEGLANADRVIFDKTGTLTRGDVRLEQTVPLRDRPIDECLAIAAALELASEHPIGAAFKHAHTNRLVATQLQTVPGFGVEGTIDDSCYRIGVAGFALELSNPATARTSDEHGSSIVLGDEHGLLARFVIADTLREDSREAVEKLAQLGIHTEILSGDSHAAVASVAQRCGIPSFLARRTPEQKLARVKAIQESGERVAMLGDGINDAPVLGAANVSIAMGRGAALAIAAADVILVSERPAALPAIVQTARRTLCIARQNLVWSATYNFCALPLAALGLIPPWIAAVGMSLSSMFVLLNALRLLPPSARGPIVAAPEPKPLVA